MSRTRAFERDKRFESGGEEVENDPRLGRPSTAKTGKNCQQSEAAGLERSQFDSANDSGWTQPKQGIIANIFLRDLGRKSCVPNWCPRFYRKTRTSFR